MNRKFLLAGILLALVASPISYFSYGDTQPKDKPESPQGKLYSKIQGVSQMTPQECSIKGAEIQPFLEHRDQVIEILIGLLSEEDDDEIRAMLDRLRKMSEENAAKYPCIYKIVSEFLDYYSGAEVEYDYYTRSLAVRAQVNTARELGWPEGKDAIESVVDILLNDRLDMMRAAAANALSEYGHTRVVAPLDYAYKYDGSPLVRRMSYRALLILTNGAYENLMQVFGGTEPRGDGRFLPPPTVFESQSQKQPSSVSAAAATSSSPVSASDQNCLTDEMYEWIMDHTIILDPRIKLDELRCSNQKESK